MYYHFLDYFFLFFHSALILFNLLGWIWKSIRKWNLLLLLLTGLSWSVLGIWYGFGYCPCTDWHWKILEELGRAPEMNSYIKYLLKRLFELNISSRAADFSTLIIYLLLLLISGYLNWRDHQKKLSNN